MSDNKNVEAKAPVHRIEVEGEQAHAPPTIPAAMEYDYTNFYFGAGDDPFALLEPFDDWYSQVEPAGYYLYELPLHTQPSTRVDIQDTKTGELRRGLINFASYNYLGLSYRPEVKKAIQEAAEVFGGGSSGSPILSGTTILHKQFEAEMAAFKGKEATLLFPTGYSANVGTIAGLMRSGDLIVADQFAHASIVDGMILSKAKSRFFRHNRADDLDRKLSGFEGKKLVIVEGVYSMDGDVPPLPELIEVCRKHGARLMIDEAHSAFLFGPTGKGVAEDQGVEDEIDIHLSLGRLHISTGNYAQAIQHFGALAKLDTARYAPQVFEAYLGLGQCFVALGDSLGASQYLQQANALNPAAAHLTQKILMGAPLPGHS